MTRVPTHEIRSHISQLYEQRRNYQQDIKELIKSYPYIVFYGCGKILNSIVETWSEYIGRKIDYCCDSDESKWGKLFCGAKCLSPIELLAIKEKCAVFITIGNFTQVFDFLTDSGFPSVNVLYKYDLVASGYLANQKQEDIINNLCKTYEILGDAQSHKVFNAIVSRVLGDGSKTNSMLEVCEKDQYFVQDLIELSANERFVDIGAFDGDTIRDFVDRTQGLFDQIFAFEVDANNFKVLHGNVQKMPDRDRIQISNLGIWDCERDITYSIGESQSTVGSGEENGHVIPLDNAMRDEKITYIKMDIEGAEPKALRGARGIIQRQKPKLAICIYHDFRHLWEIPMYIKSLVPEYKIYLRHHTNLEYETVCYAIASPSQTASLERNVQ